MAIDYLIFGLMILIGSYPNREYSDYVDTRDFQIYSLKNAPNSLIALYITFCSLMLFAFLSSIYKLIGIKSYEEAKDNSFFSKVVFVYTLITRTILTYPMVILFLSGCLGTMK